MQKQMKAWQLDRLGGTLRLIDVAIPEARPGTVVVKVEASALLSYLQAYVEGRLPAYSAPERPFILGTNGVGIVHAVGRDVWHLKPGQRVVLSPHLVAGENVEDPAQILIGLTAFGAGAKAVQADWPDGMHAEYVVLPKGVVTPADGLDHLSAPQLVTAMRCLVVLGGLQRGRLAAGETVVVTGASGTFGSAAVLVALALGAGRVIAAGRNERSLAAIATAGGARVTALALTGDAHADAKRLRDIAGGAHLAFDMIGQAGDPNATLAALHSLRRDGRLVLMGSMTVPLPIPYNDVMRNNWELIGHFMYPQDAPRRLLDLVRARLLDLTAIKPRVLPLDQLPEAMKLSSTADALECVIVTS